MKQKVQNQTNHNQQSNNTKKKTIRCGPSPISSGSSSTHFMTPSPKNNVTATASPLSSPSHQQQTQSDSPSTVNSTSTFQIRKPHVVTGTSNDSNNPNQTTQPVAQTTTLNLHGINFSSLQGAMATFPGLQNVQVRMGVSVAFIRFRNQRESESN